jgi:hypothetical protein
LPLPKKPVSIVTGTISCGFISVPGKSWLANIGSKREEPAAEYFANLRTVAVAIKNSGLAQFQASIIA